MTIMAIWNTPAQRPLQTEQLAHINTIWKQDLIKALTLASPNQTYKIHHTLPFPHHKISDPPTPTDLDIKPSKDFSKLKADNPHTQHHTVLPGTDPSDLSHLIKSHKECLSPLLYDWTNIAYTDGSCTKTKDGEKTIGAAVYYPGTASPTPITINPQGAGPTNTINRAELAGIWGALQQGHHTIASDSSTSLYQIRKALLHPQDLKFHKHHAALELILTEIDRNPSPIIRLIKVKAHASIIGNEMADAGAKEAALTETHDLKFEVDSTPGYFRDGYWYAVA